MTLFYLLTILTIGHARQYAIDCGGNHEVTSICSSGYSVRTYWFYAKSQHWFVLKITHLQDRGSVVYMDSLFSLVRPTLLAKIIVSVQKW